MGVVYSKEMRKQRSIEVEAKIWCFKNNITIYAVAITNSTLKIEINYKGTIIPGTKIYQSKGGKLNDDKWWVEIDKLYVGYYNKLK